MCKFVSQSYWLVIVLVTLFGNLRAYGQLSESQLTRFASDDTIFALHVNLQSMMGLADKESEDFKYVNEMMKNQGGYELGAMKSVLALLGHEFELDAEKDYHDPSEHMLLGIEWEKSIEPQELLDKWFGSNRDDYLDGDIEGFSFYRYDGTYYVPSLLFPNERSVILGSEKEIRHGFEGVRDNESIGGKLIGQLDTNKDLHLVINVTDLSDDKRNELYEMFASEFGDDSVREYFDHVRKVELTVDLQSNEPAHAVIEMSDNEFAEKIKSVLKTGLMMAPGMIDMARDSVDQSEESMEPMLDYAEELIEHIEVANDQNIVTINVKMMGGFTKAVDMVISMQAIQMRMFERMMKEFSKEDPFGDGGDSPFSEAVDDGDGDGDDGDGDGDDGDGDDGDGDGN